MVKVEVNLLLVIVLLGKLKSTMLTIFQKGSKKIYV